jgi:CSLREA domain-containing protein
MKNRLTNRLFTFITLLLLAASSRAANITVTNTNDALAGSLRQAIQDANPDDSIAFNIPTSDPGYDALTKVYTINLTSDGLTIGKSLAITGVGAHVVVRRNASVLFSVFTVNAGAFVAIDSLTVSNGSSLGGGGIHNLGDLTLSNCTVSGNHSSMLGGALYNDGTATIRNCTFTANQATQAAGVIANFGELTLSDSTLSRNDGGPGAGGILGFSIGTASIQNTIIAVNTSSDPGAQDVAGFFISKGYNFIGVGGGTGFGNPGSRDQVGTVANPADPKLGPLLDHGGYTPTMVPFLGSLVIDQGKRGTAGPGGTVPNDFDQRGVARPTDQAGVVNAVDGDGSDIGAVELEEYQPGPNFTVNTTEDHDSGVCGNFGCSLREALNAANTSADANTITFASAVGDTITNALTSTGLVITQPVTINGPGARRLTLSGSGTSRCLRVTGGTVVINGLTFANGSNSVDLLPGGGVQNSGGATLTLNDCTFSGNNAVSSSGIVDFGYGGGVGQFLAGQLNINRCTFADNTAGTGGAGLGNLGGTVVVTNSTFTRNAAPNGGAIASTSSLDLRSSTVLDNQATTAAGKGGGLTQLGGTFTVTNSIIAKNSSTGTAPNVSGTFVSQGSNVIGTATGATGFTDGANGDQVGAVDPKLGVFGNHGGLTDTLPLLAGSAAINQANATTAPERDQRGYVRADAPDVGAFEFGGTIPVTLANISTRLDVETGDNVLIGGFIVTGAEAKKIIVRAIGPSLPLMGKLANPTLELYDVSGLIASNDNWKSTQQADIAATGLAPLNDLESAIVATLPANNSAYTAIMRGASNTTGIGLVEVYDLDRTVGSKLANISTRGLVQTGDNVMIGGFIVLGSDAQDIIVRAIGPSLPVAGKLADPTLELHDANGVLFASNDDWRETQEEEIIATMIPPANDAESAIVKTLLPAAYTAIVRTKNGATGIALIEAYALGP